jgi:hypothetical protein
MTIKYILEMDAAEIRNALELHALAELPGDSLEIFKATTRLYTKKGAITARVTLERKAPDDESELPE